LLQLVRGTALPFHRRDAKYAELEMHKKGLGDLGVSAVKNCNF